MRATIKMIAEQSGVSVGTVDRVLHNRAYVKENVRKKVLEVVEQLNYKPNRAASALAHSSKKKQFVAIMPAFEGYILQKFKKGIEKIQQQLDDYNVKITSYIYEPERMEQCVELLENIDVETVNGIALCCPKHTRIKEALKRFEDMPIQIVTFHAALCVESNFVFVGEHAYKAGRIAAATIQPFLHREDEVLVLTNSTDPFCHEGRVEGFLARMEEHALRAKVHILDISATSAQTIQAVQRAIKQAPQIRYIYMANIDEEIGRNVIDTLKNIGAFHFMTHDLSESTLDYLKRGTIDFAIGQDLESQSYRAIQLLFEFTRDEKLKMLNDYTETSIFNGENINR